MFLICVGFSWVLYLCLFCMVLWFGKCFLDVDWVELLFVVLIILKGVVKVEGLEYFVVVVLFCLDFCFVLRFVRLIFVCLFVGEEGVLGYFGVVVFLVVVFLVVGLGFVLR